MDKLIAGFSNQLREGIKIAKSYEYKQKPIALKNIVIAGLGGSGIGGTIVSNYAFNKISIPITVVKDYALPSFTNNNTLVIISSYSGNTEETIASMQEAIKLKTTIICITSGGTIASIAKEHNIDCILVPPGMPPRACLGYSLVQLLFILQHYNLIVSSFEQELTEAINLLEKEEENIIEIAKEVALKINVKLPIIYTNPSLEGVAIRWRQQFNENSKILCWHQVIPEMNHNEIVGWRGANNDYAVIILRDQDDYERIQLRIDINKHIISKHTDTIIELYSQGNSYWEKALYLIHIGDWLSWFLARDNGKDANDVAEIDYLKEQLSKNKF